MIDVFPFAGFPVAVLGLGEQGIATARALHLSDAEVHAWDDDPARREAAAEHDIPLRDLSRIEDWRDMVSLVVEETIPHQGDTAHPLVRAARAANTEVISDAELLVRAQRDARYVAVVSRDDGGEMMNLLGHVLAVTGNEREIGGDAGRAILDLHPLDLGGTYLLDVTPGRADSTVSITYDAVILLNLGSAPWGDYAAAGQINTAIQWIFHRQTETRGAVVSIDNPATRKQLERLRKTGAQQLIPVSGRTRAPGGVYVREGALIDDMEHRAERVMPMPANRTAAEQSLALKVAAAYGAARVLGVPAHAAMASLRAHLDSLREEDC